MRTGNGGRVYLVLFFQVQFDVDPVVTLEGSSTCEPNEGEQGIICVHVIVYSMYSSVNICTSHKFNCNCLPPCTLGLQMCCGTPGVKGKYIHVELPSEAAVKVS